MLIRIFLILAILAGLGSGGVAYYEFSQQIPAIQKQRDDEKGAKNLALTQLANTNKILVKTLADLSQTRQQLADTKSELDKAVARADAQEKRAGDLQDKLTKAQADLQTTSDLLTEYKVSGLTPEQVVRLNKDLIDAQKQIVGITGERDLWQRKYAAVYARLMKYEGDDTGVVKLDPKLKGNVVVVDPKWDFVVLNIGEDKGAIQEGEMLVSRDGKLVAKVVITSVQKDRCIANIVPGWKLGEVMEGDVVTPAHPAST
jgi:cell division protein FtsB